MIFGKRVPFWEGRRAPPREWITVQVVEERGERTGLEEVPSAAQPKVFSADLLHSRVIEFGSLSLLLFLSVNLGLKRRSFSLLVSPAGLSPPLIAPSIRD